MRVLDDESAAVMSRLVQIGGSVSLVYEAFDQLGRAGHVPTLDELVRYLIAHRALLDPPPQILTQTH
jgi:hypothetical protein